MPPTSTSTNQDQESLTGLIERLTFHSTDSGFAVLRVKVSGHKDLATVIGTLPEVKAGEWVTATGRWVVDRDHGRQFKAVTLRTAPPNTVEGMTKYLASGLIKGIGPALAARLVKAFGTDPSQRRDAHPCEGDHIALVPVRALVQKPQLSA
jgi:exodeoxyribonuclease V alpha subunit